MKPYKEPQRLKLLNEGRLLAQDGQWPELALHLRKLSEGDRLRLAAHIGTRPNAIEPIADATDKLVQDEGPTRGELLDLLSRICHEHLLHQDTCPRRTHGSVECLCLKGEVLQALADAGMDP